MLTERDKQFWGKIYIEHGDKFIISPTDYGSEYSKEYGGVDTPVSMLIGGNFLESKWVERDIQKEVIYKVPKVLHVKIAPKLMGLFL